MSPTDIQANHENALLRLAKDPALWSGEFDIAARAITAAAAATLEVARCSVWLYSDDRQSIRCVDLYALDSDEHTSGTELFAADFPAYFKALNEERTIAAHDAHDDPRTAEFSESYLRPLGISAMLDTPILSQGKMVGVICHEHIGEPRTWSVPEQSFAGSVGDFTTHAIEAAKLRRNQQQLETAQAIAAVGSWVWDLRNDEVSWTDQVYRTYGHSPRSFPPDFDVLMNQVPESDRDGLATAMEKMRAEGTPYKIQHGITLPNGDVRTLECLGEAEIGDDGTPAVLFGTCHDITSLARARDAIEQREEAVFHFRTLFEQAPHFIITCDVDLKITHINRTVSPLRHDEVVGSDLNAFAAPTHQETMIDAARRIQETGETQTFELYALADDGNWGWYEAHMAGIRTRGLLDGFVIFALDVTENRELREELARTRTLEAIGRLAGGIAHDFNNITMAVRGYSDLALRANQRGEEVAPLLERLAGTTRRAEALINRIPTLEKTDRMRRRTIDLNELVTGMLDLLTPLLGKDISIVLLPSEEPAVADVDISHMERILLNLGVNAREAMTDGGVLTLTVDHRKAVDRPDDEAGPSGVTHAVVTVQDNGIGMTEEVKRRVFEPFFSTRSTGHATGLGLFTSRYLAEQQGGFIRFDTAPGEGTSFDVCLPISSGTPVPLERRSGSISPPSGDETILAVEDDPDVRALLVLVLEGCGYQVHEAASGEEALSLAGRLETPPDLLLTDVRMGLMSGLDLAKELIAKDANLKVLFISSHVDEESLWDVETAHFLHKPVGPMQLAREVRNILDDPA